MALDKADGSKWKPYNKVKATSSTEKVWCFGTLRAEFSMVRGKAISCFHSTNSPHICYNPTALLGPNPETRPLLMLVFPSPSWNISKAVTDNMKEAFCSSIKPPLDQSDKVRDSKTLPKGVVHKQISPKGKQSGNGSNSAICNSCCFAALQSVDIV
jgi:hypothetical protein